MYIPVGTQNNTHEMYMKIYARLAADFCSKSAGDKSCMLTIFEGGLSGPIAGARNDAIQQQQEQWIDLATKLKTTIGNTFIARCRAYSDDVKKLEDARPSAPSSDKGGGEWDFFALFFAKESLALMHEQLQLPAEALVHYQELTSMCNKYQAFLPCLPPKALMMFQNKAGLPILDFPVFEVRKVIVINIPSSLTLS